MRRENKKKHHNLSCGKYEIIKSIKNTRQSRIDIFTDIDKNYLRKHVQ